MELYIIAGERIRQLRKALKMTQEEFACEICIDANHLSRIERGIKGISIDKMVLICERFEVGMDELIPIIHNETSLKEKLINEIHEIIKGMNTLEVATLRKLLGNLE